MTTQLDMFSGVAFTSKKAYAEITYEGVKQSLYDKVYELLNTHSNGLTRSEMEAISGIR